MYGIVNKSIEDMVTSHFGADKWEAVKLRSGVDVDFFISHEVYDDDVTFRMATAASEELEMPVGDVLQSFGEWWVLKTSKERYGGIMEAGGSDLPEFLKNLPMFHTRVMLIYTKLTPPEFQVSDITENSICIHYRSTRQGLQEFVRGILSGLGKMYNTPVTIELIQSRLEGSDHEIFKVSW